MSGPGKVADHYGANSFVSDLDTALSEAGLTGRQLTPVDLAPLDQFHAGAWRPPRNSPKRRGFSTTNASLTWAPA